MTLFTSGPQLSPTTLIRGLIPRGRELVTNAYGAGTGGPGTHRCTTCGHNQPQQDDPREQPHDPNDNTKATIDILKALGIYAEWQQLCKPLGCQALKALNPLHECAHTGAWEPAPIAGT